MIKKILPLALCGLLAGCAAIKEFAPLQSGLQTFFVRSLVVAKPDASVDKHAFLIWASTGDKITAMKRGVGAGAEPTNAVAIDTNTSFHDDTNVSEGATYVYGASFGEKTLKRTIKVLEVSAAGSMQSLTPNLTTASSQPTFGWAVDESNGKPSGFLISVVKVPDGVTDSNALTGATPLYTAFLDAASHSTGVKFGTASDMPAFTEELLTVLAQADSKYAKKDKDLQPLTAGSYGWVVAPIAVDKEKASFAIGTQAAAFFTVAP